jgi:Inner membrane protein YgaP-like, transmembrane domain
MNKNIGGIERIIRIVAGLGILSLVFIGPETRWGYLGLIPLATGLISWCPIYQLLGISTCKACK